MTADPGSVDPCGRLLSLAAGVILDVDPVRAVDVAARSGFGGVGIWFDPSTFTPAVATAVKARLDATGVIPVDIEPIILSGSGDPGDALVDAAIEIGARFILLASRQPDRAAAVARTQALCARAAVGGVTIAVEFLPPFAVNSLTSAAAFAADVAAPNCAVLIDALHLDRSHGSVEQVRSYPTALFPYLQLCDGPATPGADWTEEALYGRLLPGDGDLPLVELLQAVPAVPVSVELRSRALHQTFPDPVERAAAVLEATRRVVVASR